jgi:hypothetical protein
VPLPRIQASAPGRSERRHGAPVDEPRAGVELRKRGDGRMRQRAIRIFCEGCGSADRPWSAREQAVRATCRAILEAFAHPGGEGAPRDDESPSGSAPGGAYPCRPSPPAPLPQTARERGDASLDVGGVHRPVPYPQPSSPRRGTSCGRCGEFIRSADVRTGLSLPLFCCPPGLAPPHQPNMSSPKENPPPPLPPFLGFSGLARW